MKLYIILLTTILTPNITLKSQTDSYSMVERMGRGINLGNVLSAPVEGNWAAIVEQQYFVDVAAAGFTNVRIPIDFFGARTSGDTSGYSNAAGTSGSYSGTSADYIVSSTDLDRIEQVVEWSLNQGLVTIIDFHGSNLKSEFIYTFDLNETEYTYPTSAKRAADNEKFRTIWAQVADRFKNHSENLLFEVVNEPYFHMSADEMDALNTDIINIIRGSGGSNGTRNIIITGGGASSHNAPLQIESSIISDNSYLIATFHYYQPFNFTSSSADARDDESWGTVEDKNTLVDRFDEVQTWAITNDIPIFLGEFGADNSGGYNYSKGDLNDISGNETGYADGGPDNTSRVAYHGFIAEQAINRGFSFAAWDSGPKSNKTIHMRTDSSASANYDIDYFSVSSYNPKVTTKSTVLDNATWVEDVKNALFESGTWPLSNAQKTENYLINSDFESWTNQSKLSSWILNNNSGDASNITQTQTSENSVRNSTTSVKFVTTLSGKGILQTSSPITIGTAGKYFFGVWIKSTDSGHIKLGLKLQNGLNTTYPGNAVTILDSDWHYYVYHADLQVGDKVSPRIVPQGSGVFYIDDANFSEGFGGANVEWDNLNGTATTHSDFWSIRNYGGATNGSLSENTDTTYVKSGYSSLRLITNAEASNLKRGVIALNNNENQGNRYVHPATTRKYQVAAWVYANNAANIVLNVSAGANNTTNHSISANTWTQIVSDIIELDRDDFGTVIYPKIEFKTPGTTHYVDDVYLNWGGVTWNGSTSTDWHTISNWTPNIVPGENVQVSIPENLSNYPTTSSDVTVGSVSMAAGSSLIAQATFYGEITYTRNLESTNWYLISSPVVGQDIDAFVSTSNLAAASANNNIGLGDYNNATPGWTYYQSGSSGTGDFTSGDGRAIKLASTGELSFTGAIDVNDSGVGIEITTNFDGYNLIGNPYPSYVAANNSADSTNNILKVNDTDNDYLTEATLWFWNQSTDSYDQINQASSATYIAPTQGFFVRSNGSHSFRFTEDMQSHQSFDNFQRSSARPEIELTLSNGSDTRNADIFYIEGTTMGWDNGYDSTIFGGVGNDFQIYTHLVSNSQEQDLGIQSLPNNNFENIIIPIGINAVSGSNITIDALIKNFPLGMRVYLEDKEDNSFTRLDSESNFSTTLKSNLQGIGRFYLHSTTAALSTSNKSPSTSINIYLTSRENLRIVGVENGTANVYVYNMIGKEVLRTSFEGIDINDVQLPKLSKAVYIVKISTLNETFNKKIIIR